MSTMLEMLMARVGQSKVPKYAREQVGFRAVVMASGEFQRIKNLPRRIWDCPPRRVHQIAETIERECGTADRKMKLWPIQAMALHDICIYRGAFLPIGVGQGKALISLLAPVVAEAKRPLLIVPAALRDQTLRKVLPEMAEQWKLHPNLQIIGYSELSLVKNVDLLEDYQPDLIVLDECHRVKNKRAGRTRRLSRYFDDHPDTMCVAMSGTVSNKSIKDFAHIIHWALKASAPVPTTYHELCEWADAIDEGVDERQQVGPGALLSFCEEGENVRQGFRRRLTETPGVVASQDKDLGVSLRIEKFEGLVIPPVVASMLDTMRDTWTTPNGDTIAEAIDLWRHMRELALGFWYRWDPEPPREWLDARKLWKSDVRNAISYQRKELIDTELQFWNACEKAANEGRLPVDHSWREWKRLKDTFKINTVAEWVDDFAIDECARWLMYGEEKAICWVAHNAFGERLTQKTSITYYGAGNKKILDTKDPAIIASVSAHGEGKNLQRFSKNLVVAPSSNGGTWEQLLGRTHREGQQADEVTCEMFLHVPEFLEAFHTAQSTAKYLEDTYGNRQKLNFADILI